ncbi:hypothetical protein FGO68_gene11396 [Halteria grandinella]|uniref:Uncharacterized protein n=1 Tax=Halteria grandinella TaxID=5974 RepID=A0A8J8T4T3_HALGN|nr:hypothetical protein FGO68_gene11396 [Halteria grandinella]
MMDLQQFYLQYDVFSLLLPAATAALRLCPPPEALPQNQNHLPHPITGAHQHPRKCPQWIPHYNRACQLAITLKAQE